MEDIREMVLEIVGDHLGIPAPTLSVESHILHDLGADSLDQMELIMTVEELFGIKIDDRNIADIVTIQEIIEAVTSGLPNVYDLSEIKQAWRTASRKYT